MVLHEALRMAAVGLVLGLVLAYTAGRGMEALLAGVPPADAPTFLAATGLSALMTLAGSLLRPSAPCTSIRSRRSAPSSRPWPEPVGAS